MVSHQSNWTAAKFIIISSTPLLVATHSGLSSVSEWLNNVHSGRIAHLRDEAIISLFEFRFRKRAKDSEDARKRSRIEQIADIKKIKEVLSTTLQAFRDETRSAKQNIMLYAYSLSFVKAYRFRIIPSAL
jgi:hypothetical protein